MTMNQVTAQTTALIAKLACALARQAAAEDDAREVSAEDDACEMRLVHSFVIPELHRFKCRNVLVEVYAPVC